MHAPYETQPVNAIMITSRTRFSALCLAVCLLAVLSKSLLSIDSATYIAAPLLLAYIAINLGHTSVVVRVFFAISVLLMVSSAVTRVSADDILAGLDRMLYLGSLLSALGFMRVVAAQDAHFARAGRFLSSQPPARRYVSMYLGGHMFTTLLNMGGLGLLVETVLSAMQRRRASMSEAVFQLRERRIVSAIMRGFGTIAFWTPFGVALNSMLLVFTDLHWADVAPYGLLFALLALALGWAMDGVERRLKPLSPPPRVDPAEPGDQSSTLIVVLHVLALGAAIFILDTLLPVSFQLVLLFAVPIYALLWISALQGRGGVHILTGKFVERAPTFVTEIGVFSLAGLIGPMMVALIPDALLDPVFAALGNHSIALALLLMWTTVAAGVVGIHPIISVIVLGELVVRNGGISELAAILALLAGWASAVTLAPFATTAVFVGRLTGRGVWRVTWGWNGLYSLALLVLFSALLAAGLSFGLL